MLAVKKVFDGSGALVETDFIDDKLAILQKIIEYDIEQRGKLAGTSSSSDRTSKASRHADLIMKPPQIAIEVQHTDPDRVSRSKTLISAKLESMV